MLREFPLPPASAGAARCWLEGSRQAGPARPAATVVLVRDGDAGVEVFLLRRRLSMAFAAGMYVFPGGGVDPRDGAGDLAWSGPDAAAWASELGTCSPAQARAVVCAAVRETFEECGLLLAGPAGGGERSGLPRSGKDDDWEAERAALVARETALSDVLRRRHLVLRSELLRAWAHWTTPLHEARRYDTRFLLAMLPQGQAARHVEGEADESGWWPAAAVLDSFAAGQVALLPPTLVTVEEVAAASSAAKLWGTRRRVRRVLPVLQLRGDRLVLVADLPDQPDRAGQR